MTININSNEIMSQDTWKLFCFVIFITLALIGLHVTSEWIIALWNVLMAALIAMSIHAQGKAGKR